MTRLFAASNRSVLLYCISAHNRHVNAYSSCSLFLSPIHSTHWYCGYFTSFILNSFFIDSGILNSITIYRSILYEPKVVLASTTAFDMHRCKIVINTKYRIGGTRENMLFAHSVRWWTGVSQRRKEDWKKMIE